MSVDVAVGSWATGFEIAHLKTDEVIHGEQRLFQGASWGLHQLQLLPSFLPSSALIGAIFN